MKTQSSYSVIDWPADNLRIEREAFACLWDLAAARHRPFHHAFATESAGLPRPFCLTALASAFALSFASISERPSLTFGLSAL
jgi:hypothetical protein